MASTQHIEPILTTSTAANDTVTYPLFNLRLMFYLIHPKEVPEIEGVNDVPNYPNQAIFVFFGLLVLESILKYWFTGKTFRVNDTITSIGAGVSSQSIKFILRSLDTATYIWIFNNYRLWTVPLRLWWSWVLALLAVDLGYYWIHRAAHEISILWSTHQTHHSSEEFNLSTALRQSVFGGLYGWIVYLPMALFGFSPVAHVIHEHLNTLYQFYIHTAMIKSMGPLEWILNTPSHHRVHHGRNPYCIDKNYAGVLIIWDRMFGTFEPEHPEEAVVYGIVTPVSSFNGIYVQFNNFFCTLKRITTYKRLEDKIKSLLMGPGWYPGTKRLGNPTDIPSIESPVRTYDVQVSTWKTVYAVIHFMVLIAFFHHTAEHYEEWTDATVYLVVIGGLFSVGNIGSIMDDRRWIPLAELARCGVFGLLMSRSADIGISLNVAVAFRWFFALSTLLWTIVLADRTFAEERASTGSKKTM